MAGRRATTRGAWPSASFGLGLRPRGLAIHVFPAAMDSLAVGLGEPGRSCRRELGINASHRASAKGLRRGKALIAGCLAEGGGQGVIHTLEQISEVLLLGMGEVGDQVIVRDRG